MRIRRCSLYGLIAVGKAIRDSFVWKMHKILIVSPESLKILWQFENFGTSLLGAPIEILWQRTRQDEGKKRAIELTLEVIKKNKQAKCGIF